MADNVCCVCGNPGTNLIGQRVFCDIHLKTATHERTSAWRSIWGQVIALVLFVFVIYGAQAIIKPVIGSTALVVTGVLLAIFLSIFWLAFFYQQDRLEAEPKSFVFGVFILGALLASAVGVPLVENIFHVSSWLTTNTLTSILGGILVIGFTQEFLKYAAVRYSVYHSVEFDEPTDGIVYATAAGLGYAMVLNVQFVISNGGVDLGAGVIYMAVVALAQASFAGITGYFLGRAKFESESLFWMPAGITLAAILNGLFFWLRGWLVQSTATLTNGGGNTWLGLILAATLAIITTGVLSWLIRQNIKTALKA
jgi:RsiW-degrading membrane proteinase PrsW (M82 family)